MKTSQRDSVTLRGGKYDGCLVALDFVEDDVDVIWIGSGENRAIYAFDGSEFRPATLNSIDPLHKVLQVPSPHDFETARSLGTSTSSSGMAEIRSLLRSMGRVQNDYIAKVAKAMAARGVSRDEIATKILDLQQDALEMTNAELIEAIKRLDLVLGVDWRQTAVKNRREYEQKKIDYKKSVTAGR